MSFKEITGHILDCLLLVNLSTRQMSKYRSRHDVKSWGWDDFFFSAERGRGILLCEFNKFESPSRPVHRGLNSEIVESINNHAISIFKITV